VAVERKGRTHGYDTDGEEAEGIVRAEWMLVLDADAEKRTNLSY
jgi:hypothetical protein